MKFTACISGFMSIIFSMVPNIPECLWLYLCSFIVVCIKLKEFRVKIYNGLYKKRKNKFFITFKVCFSKKDDAFPKVFQVSIFILLYNLTIHNEIYRQEIL